MQIIENKNEINDKDYERLELQNTDSGIDRTAPISEAEVFGVGLLRDGSIVLELGFIKNVEKNQVVIDVRKKLNRHMVIDLRDHLTSIIENEDD